MEKTVAVFHEGALAHYNVSEEGNGTFKARLLKYSGRPDNDPPREFLLHKEGRHWADDDVEQDIVDDIGQAIELQIKNMDRPVYHSRGHERNGPSPAGSP
ncbi:MAG TPA: hypothetical protein VNA26_06055 [Chitinophagaceae bacterium]|nr:hypothetical protein [Chitinophagaceae bacterium]